MKQTPEQPSVIVCDVQFRNNSKIYYFDPGKLRLEANDNVIIDTSRGLEFGLCVRGNHPVSEHEVVLPLRSVVRRATAQDQAINEENRKREKRAFDICLKKIEELGMEMQLISAEYAFDGSKIMFFFTADGRVDFRDLVKNLAAVLRTRIELRQIGVRDKAKMVGGLGICGRPFCCREFLDDFQPVSIKMAKTQNLSLNPTKISGTCGRLMCCLNYEQEAYEDLLRTSPKPESFVDTPDGRGTITDVNLLRQSVHVRLEKQPDTIVCHKNCDICVLRNGKPKKTDEPIPEDLAPISGKLKKKSAEPTPFSTYLEPVVLKRSAETIAEPVTSKEAVQTASQPSKRRRRGGKKHKSAAKPTEAAVQKPEKPVKPEKPLKVEKLIKAEKPERAPKPEKEQRPVRETDEVQKQTKHRRRYHHRRKSGTNKPEA